MMIRALAFSAALLPGSAPVPVRAPSAALAPSAAMGALAPAAALSASPSLSAVLAAAPAAPAPSAAASLRALSAAPEAASPRSAARVFDAAAERADGVLFHETRLPPRAFSDDEVKISERLVAAIDATRKRLDLALYELAHRELFEALVRAKGRGVKVRVVIDESRVFPRKEGQQRRAEVQGLIDEGFDIRIVRGRWNHGIMHHKFGVFDGRLLETGSFNWTRAADERHHEDVLFTAEKPRVEFFAKEWARLWRMGRRFEQGPSPAADPEVEPPPLKRAPADARRVVAFHEIKLPRQAMSPGRIEAELTRAIDAARKTVDVANFSFTNQGIADALERARKRKVKVRLLFDREQFKFLDRMKELRARGFDVRLSDGRGERSAMHHKFVVLDGILLETGSYNGTENAERNNFENASFLGAEDAAAYGKRFGKLWKGAKKPTKAELEPRVDPRAASDAAVASPV